MSVGFADKPVGFAEKLVGFTNMILYEVQEDLLVGEIRELASRQGVKTERTFGFWYREKISANRLIEKPLPVKRLFYFFMVRAFIIFTACYTY